MKRARLVLLGLLLAASAAVPSLAGGKGGGHERFTGEVLGLDREAGTITVQIVAGDEKETRVFQVTGRTVIKDHERKPITLAGVKAGQRVRVRSLRSEGLREALEIRVKRDRKVEP